MKLAVEESDFIACDVFDVVRYLRRGNPELARRFIEALKGTVELLSRSPHIGRPRSDLGVPETRSWRVSGFAHWLIFYEVLPGRIRLLRVLHGRRDLQAELEK